MNPLSLPLVAVTIREKPVGSGTVVSHGEDHTDILMTHHQIGRKRCGAITYRVKDGFAGCRFDVVSKLKEHDLALIRTVRRIPVPAAIISTEEPELYEEVTAVGCPSSLFGTIVVTKLTAMNGSNGTHEDRGVDSLYQLSSPVGFGMSGGPLLNSRCELIGIVATGIDAAFVSFARPLPTVRRFLGLK